LLDSTRAGVVFEGANGLLLAVNTRLCEMFRIPARPETLQGRPGAEVAEHCLRLLVDPAGFLDHLDRIRRDGAEVTGEELLLKDGRTLVRDYQPIPGSNRESSGHAWLYRDVSARKRTETVLRDTEAQLRRSQRLEAVGRMAGGVVHDFNNLLMVMMGYSEILIGELQDRDELREGAEQIRETAQRASALTRHLLAFSREQSLTPEILNPNTLIGTMGRMLRHMIRADIEIVHVLDPELGHIEADAGQVEQVLLNLLVNAVDAMPRGGKIVIESANVDLDPEYESRHVGVRAGPYVRLTVNDTGCGMDDETLQHVFDPFFTTKETGTGLGLSTAYGIVKQSGGNIWAYSEPGLGTIFKIYLPRVDKIAVVRPLEVASTAATRGTETLLLVEDEDAVRNLMRNVLEQDGYSVLEADRPREALRICEEHDGPIDLLLTDVVMPQMTGRELARRVTATHRRIKTLFMSGYNAKALSTQGVLDSGVAFVEKPISPRKVAQKVRELLGEGPRSSH
jgi:signal transduction histidine kinase/CheY-like chemotaxis protein